MSEIKQCVMFPPIERLRISIKDWDSKKALLLDLLNTSKIDNDYGIGEHIPNSSYFYPNSEVGNKVSEILAEEIHLLSKQMFNSANVVVEPWFQTYSPRQFHPIHNHVRSTCASVIYLDYDKRFHFPTIYNCNNAFSGDPENWFDVNDEEGYWYVWPAGVMHYTVPCNHPEAPLRKIMSANIHVNHLKTNSHTND